MLSCSRAHRLRPRLHSAMALSYRLDTQGIWWQGRPAPNLLLPLTTHLLPKLQLCAESASCSARAVSSSWQFGPSLGSCPYMTPLVSACDKLLPSTSLLQPAYIRAKPPQLKWSTEEDSSVQVTTFTPPAVRVRGRHRRQPFRGTCDLSEHPVIKHSAMKGSSGLCSKASQWRPVLWMSSGKTRIKQ